MSIFTGAGTALVTPFNDKGVDFSAFETLIEYQIDGGIDALIVCGTTGESSTMTKEEDMQAIDFVVKQAAGRVPVIAGTGSNNTQTAIETSKEAAGLGVDGLLVVTPYYNKCTDAGLIRHYFAIADAVRIPIIAYNVPGRTTVNISPLVMKEIGMHDNIAAVKEASANITQIAESARVCPNIDIYSGNDDHVVPVLSLGGKGVISVVSNVAPHMMHEMVESYLSGDHARALELQFALNPLVKALFSEVNPIPVKKAMNMIGIKVGLPRMPLTEMSPDKAALLENELRKLGFDVM